MYAKPNLTQQLVIILFVFLAVALSRLYYVNSFAVTLPFWDQWDAEGDFLLRPWIENRLRISDLWQPHNEHRIFPTRLLSLFIFQVTGEWNNLTEARVNIILAAVIPSLLVWVLFRNGVLRGIRWFIIPVILAQFALPFSFENLLFGFQSQFYFLMLFSLTALFIAAYRPESVYFTSAVLLLSVLSVFTMASGLLTPVAVASIYILNSYLKSQLRWHNLLIIAALFVIAIAGFFLVPKIAVHQVYKVQNISGFFNALGYILSWPFVGVQLMAFVLWTPAIIMVPLLLFRKSLTRADLLMTGCFIWSFCQACVIAYGRGNELTLVSSRYTELLTPGLISNAWFIIRFAEQFGKPAFWWIAAAFICTLMYGHKTHIPLDMHELQRNHANSLLQIQNVCMYLKTSDTTSLQKPQFEIPFPNPVRLRALLDNPVIREILPEPVKECVHK